MGGHSLSFAPRRVALEEHSMTRAPFRRSERRLRVTADRLPFPYPAFAQPEARLPPSVTFIAFCSKSVGTCQGKSAPSHPPGIRAGAAAAGSASSCHEVAVPGGSNDHRDLGTEVL
jgi:hypothetical protein